MCRYGFISYKPHLACFTCRKAFKRVKLEDYLAQYPMLSKQYHALNPYAQWARKNPAQLRERELELGTTQAEIVAKYRELIGKCSQCGGQMADLGLDFKAPRTADKRAWRAIESTYRLGHAWHTCGCSGPGFIPNSPREYRVYLQERLTTFQRRVESIKRQDSDRNQQLEAEAYWRDRIGRIESELVQLR